MKTLFRIIGKFVKFVFILALVVVIAGIALTVGILKSGDGDRYVPSPTQRTTYPTVTVAPATEPARTEPTAEEDPSTEPEPLEDVDFRAWVDSYEEFMFRYADFLEKYTNSGSPISMLSDYSRIMIEYGEYLDQMDRLNTDDLSAADLTYLSAAQLRVLDRLSKID